MPEDIDLTVAAKHVSYEIKMLAALHAWTLKLYEAAPRNVPSNACLEATLLHARIMIEFLAGRPGTGQRWNLRDLAPHDFFAGGRHPDHTYSTVTWSTSTASSPTFQGCGLT